jgi:hypothetical protein
MPAMSDEQSIDSEFSPTVAVAEGTSNGTGEHAAPGTESGDAPAAGATDAAADASAEGETAPAVAESPGDAPDSGATGSEAAAVAPDGADFLAQLADAMRATAGTERARVAEDIERRRAAQVALIEGRRDAEASRMRELADDDRKAIDAWAEAEQQRIQAERERRTRELEDDLTRSLAEHAGQIDGRIQAVEQAVQAHRADVDAFFTALEAETDPVRIAQQAGRRPAFPDLDASAEPAGASPSTATAAEPVGVMDPVARLGLSATPEEATRASDEALLRRVPAGRPTPSTTPIPSILAPLNARTSGRPGEPEAKADGDSETKVESEPEPVAHGHAPSGLKPMGWLRRGNDQGDR